MAVLLSLLYSAGIALVALLVFRRVNTYFRGRQFSQKYGCLPPNKDVFLTDPLGIGLLRKLGAAKKKNATLAFIKGRYEANKFTCWSRLLVNEVILTAEPQNLQAILATKQADFDLGPIRRNAFAPLLGKGTFTVDGGEWKHIRGLIRPAFARQQVADISMLDEHVTKMFELIPQDGSKFDLQKLFFRLTLDSATHFLFGESLDSLDPSPAKETEDFGDALAKAQDRLFFRSRVGWVGNLLPDKVLKESCAQVHGVVDRYVDAAIARRKALDKGESAKPLDEKKRYVFLDELAQQTTDKKTLRDQLTNVLLAGRDTTASLLSSTFLILSQRPDIWSKLHEEVAALGDTELTFEVLKQMKYLRWVLSESLRLFPPVPINGRQANKDTYLPTGGGPERKAPVFVPAGQFVSYNVYTLHRRKDLWGEDADDFKPERWEKHLPGWDYIPFNAGPRICLGQQYALTEASYTTVRLLQKFKQIESHDPRPWTEGLEFTVRVGQGVQISLRP